MAEGFAVTSLDNLMDQIEEKGGQHLAATSKRYVEELVNAVGRGALIRREVGHGLVHGILNLWSHATQTCLNVHYYINMAGVWGKVEIGRYKLPDPPRVPLAARLRVTYDCSLKTRGEWAAADRFKIHDGVNSIVGRLWSAC